MAWFRKNWRNPIRSNSTKIRGTLNSGTPIPISLPYHSHKNPLKYGNGMGMIWEAYGKGVPLLRVPGKIPNSNPSNPLLCYTWRMGPNLVSSYIVTPIYKPWFFGHLEGVPQPQVLGTYNHHGLKTTYPSVMG